MAVLIGGSSSTGSSLLRTMLNRHPQILSGAELNFFNKRVLYTDWNSHKQKLLNGSSLTTDGWQPMPGNNLLNEDYGWSGSELEKLISQTDNIKAFTSTFFSKALIQNGKQLWVEKTPSDAYCFHEFLHAFPNGKVVHISRNPFDTIASLIHRGYDPYFATAWWIYNTAAAMGAEQSERYYHLTYEDLVLSPEQTVVNLLRFLGVEQIPDIVQAKREQQNEPTTMKGWKHEQTGKVSAASLGRFGELSIAQKDKVFKSLAQITISPKHLEVLNTQYENASAIVKKLDYTLKLPEKIPGNISYYYYKDRFMRWLRGWNKEGYPVEI